MLGEIYEWSKSHPLSSAIAINVIVGIALLFLSPVVAPIVNGFWKLGAVPPQRLNLWLLKARLASAESRLRTTQRIQEDIRAYVCETVYSLMMALTFCWLVLITFLLMILSMVYTASHSKPDSFFESFAAAISVISLIFEVLSVSQINLIMSVGRNPGAQIRKIEATIARLKAKL
ncbi:MAG TPA: hypothetical protein VGG45_09185 [Terracidiphilus sp.]